MDIKKFNKQLSATKLRVATYKRAGFFINVLYNLRTMADTSVPTAGTDGLRIVINPDFFDRLSVEERMFLLLHETLHVCLKHTQRKQGRDHRLWNVAADYVINLSLENYGLKTPSGGLIDHKYAGMTSEAVYEQLVREGNQQEPDYDDLMPPSPDQSQEIDDVLKRAETASRMGGHSLEDLPAELRQHIQEMNEPKLNWRVILQRFMYETSRDDYSFRKPNRKFFPKYYLPSLHSEGLSRVDFIVDTSGSIDDEQFNQFISEVDKVLKQFMPKSIGFTQFDTQYHGTQMIDRFSDVTKLEFRGGGGTCIRSTMEAVKDFPTKCLIVFTDGWMNTDFIDPGIPTVWAVYGGCDFKPPFGKVIHFDLDDLN